MTTSERVRVVDIRIGPGRQTLRVSVVDRDGEQSVLTLAPGHGGGETGDPFCRPDWLGPPLQLPATVIPALEDALKALRADGAR